MSTIKYNAGAAGLTLFAKLQDADTDYWVLSADGSTEAYNASHLANYKHAATEPGMAGQYVFTISDDLASGSYNIQIVDAAGNGWAAWTDYWDEVTWHKLKADVVVAKTAAEAVDTRLTGITSLAAWLRGLFRKSTMDTTAKSEVNTGGGTYNEATDSLEAQQEQSATGQGARTITITVTDSTSPLEGAKVRMQKGAESYIATTNASGRVVVGRDDGTWSVAITLAGYTFTPTTLVVTADDATIEYEMTAVTIPTSDGDRVTGYLYCYDENGDPEQGVVVQMRMKTHTGYGSSHDTKVRSVSSNADGLVSFTNLLPGATYQMKRGDSGDWDDAAIPASASDPYALPNVLGEEDA